MNITITKALASAVVKDISSAMGRRAAIDVRLLFQSTIWELTMADPQKLRPAAEMVKKNAAHVLNESKEYRQARDALLDEEIELRRHIVRVAEQRRALPPEAKSRRTTASRAKAVPSASPSCLATRTPW